MRIALLLSLAACACAVSPARADESLIRVEVGERTCYIVPEAYASAYRAEIVASITGLEHPVRIDGFWTPTEVDVAVSERVFRELIHAGAKDATVLFPDLAPDPDPNAPLDPGRAQQLEQERIELGLISQNYDSYVRQYVGIIIDGQKLVFCNYSKGTKADPAAGYIFIQKTFAANGTHFLQGRFEPDGKTVSNVAIIGTWQVQK